MKNSILSISLTLNAIAVPALAALFMGVVTIGSTQPKETSYSQREVDQFTAFLEAQQIANGGR